VVRAFATGQVVVMSSLSEGLPLTVIEAAMVGRPLVVTDVGGMPEAAGPAGLVVRPNDPSAFAAACVELLTDPGRRLALSTAGRRHALAHFTLDRFLGNVRNVYAEFTAPAAAPVPVAPAVAPAAPAAAPAAVVHIPAQRDARPDVPSLSGGRA
jgi:glycosyltransferase involved in cell wall biosynthesis